MKHRNKLWFILTLVFILFLLPLPISTFAQQEAPPPTNTVSVADQSPAPLPIISLGPISDANVDTTPIVVPDAPLVDISQAGNTLITAMIAIASAGIAGAGLAPVVTALVGFAKNFVSTNAPTLNALFSLAIWAILAVAARFGLDHQVSSLLGLIAQMLPLVWGFIATLASAPAVHEWMAAHNVPVLGDKRTPEVVQLTGSNDRVGYSGSGQLTAFVEPLNAQAGSPFITQHDLDTRLANLADTVADAVILKLNTASG